GSNAARLREERRPLVRQQMSVEVAREDAVELVRLERECGCVALDQAGAGQSLRCDLEHRGALVEAGDLAAQMPGQEPRAACDIEHAARLEAGDDARELLDLLVPPRAHAGREEARPEPPVVVLPGAAVVVAANRDVDDLPGHASKARLRAR